MDSSNSGSLFGIWVLHIIVAAFTFAPNVPCYGALSKFSFPALIIFGDSTVDTGNNNHLETIFRCDHAPYGRDFFEQQASGRWSDGSMALDYVAQKLELPSPIPYLDPNANGAAILTGINFASGGAGLLDSTSEEVGIIPLSKQLNWYLDYQNKLRNLLGETRAAFILSNALHVISIGTNDYIANFYLPPDVTHTGNLSDFRSALLENYEQYLEALYDGGARIVAIVGVPPMGCLPYAMAFYNTTDPSGCVQYMNLEAEAFNNGLKNLLSELTAKLSGMKLIYVDLYSILHDIVTNFQNYGFKVPTRGCCGKGIFAFGPTCSLLAFGTCKDTQDYVFFDAIHPTQHTAQLVARALFSTLDADL